MQLRSPEHGATRVSFLYVKVVSRVGPRSGERSYIRNLYCDRRAVVDEVPDEAMDWNGLRDIDGWACCWFRTAGREG